MCHILCFTQYARHRLPCQPPPASMAYAAPVDRRIFSVVQVLVGVTGLLLKPHYRGPAETLVHSYLGNVSASFAVFFIVSLPLPVARRPAWVAAAIALLVVQAFEVTDGFGLMTNTYDPRDLVANAVGVALAWLVDWSWRRGRPASAS